MDFQFDQNIFLDLDLSDGFAAVRDRIALELEPNKEDIDHESYQDDPVRWGEDVLGETYTDDVKRLMYSVRDNRDTLAKSANSTGKAFPLWTKVVTPSGWRQIGSLSEGDLVMGSNGLPTRVTGVFPQGVRRTYRITFNDGSTILASDEHLWNARSATEKYRSRPFRTYTTEELIPLLHRVMEIPITTPVEFPTEEYVIDPYAMGALIGDGTLGQGVRFDTDDDEIFELISGKFDGLANVVRYANKPTHCGIITPAGQPNPILDECRLLGIHGDGALDKHIPERYMRGASAQRVELLRGLMDTDGTVDKRNGTVSFVTISPKLADQFVELVQSLGGTATKTSKIPTYTHNGERRFGKRAYTIHFKVPMNPFRLTRKAELWIDPATKSRGIHRIIESIERVQDEDSVCIRVEADDRLFLTEHYIVTHNSHAAARIALWFFFCFPDSQVYTAAAPPEDNLRTILWAEIGRIVEKHPTLFKNVKVNDLLIQRHKKSFIKGITIPTQGTESQREARFSGKHAPSIMFIFDEADGIPNECYRGAESCMTNSHARLLAMFNPRHESGILYQKEKKKVIRVVGLNAFRHPNVVSGTDIYPGAVDRATTIRRINEWTEPLQPGERVDAECYEVPDFLVGETTASPAGEMYPALEAGWRRIIEPQFSYMVLGEYPAVAEGQLISRAWVNNARARWDSYVAQNGRKPPFGVKPVLGLDVAEMGVDSNVLAKRYGGYIAPLDTWNEIDVNQTADIAADHFFNNQAEFIAVDGTGVGAGVAPKLNSEFGAEAYSVKMNSKPVFEVEEGEFTHMRDQLWWMTREWLRHDKSAMLPPDEKLIEELTTPTYSVTSGKIKIMKKEDMRKSLGRSPDRAEAVILTFYNEYIESQDADSLLGRVLLGNPDE